LKKNTKISILSQNEIYKFKKFIKINHSKKHIFVKSSKVLKWFYNNKKKLNFIIAHNNKDILGVQGFIPTNKFDKNLDNSIFLAYWRVKKTKEIGIGLKIFKYLSKNRNFIGVVGIENNLLNYHKWQGFNVGRLNHYFIKNKKYNLPIFIKKKNKDTLIYRKIKINHINKTNILKNVKEDIFKYQFPQKSKKYILKRYLKCPFYDYKVFKIAYLDEVTLFVIRIIEIKKTKILKLVDLIGKQENIKNCGKFFDFILNRYNAEYLDFYSFGIKKKCLLKAGFKDRYSTNLILPDHFEPFEFKNININYAFKFNSKKEEKKYLSKIRIVKGDGDMDRPSLIKSL